MGRKTWDLAVSAGQPRFGGKKNYVFTRSPCRAGALSRSGLASSSRPERSPSRVFAQRLRHEKGKDIWLVGGASLFAAFLDAGEVDRIIVHVKPILIGEGIPLVDAARSSRSPAARVRAGNTRTEPCAWSTRSLVPLDRP